MDERELFIDSIKTGSVKNFYKYYDNKYFEKTDDWYPIHYACVYNKISILKLLIERKCNIEACTEKSYRPIHFACRYGFSDIAEELISAGCDIQPVDEDEWTPLHHACSEGHMEIVEKLIHKNCDIEAMDKNKWRPIHHACLNQHIEIVVILMEKKCNIQAQTLSKQSPLDIAKQKKNDKLIKILNLVKSQEIYQMAQSMDVLCRYGCDHNFCSTSLILENFPHRKRLGSGSYGKVYSCKSSQTLKEFAIKFIKNEPYYEKSINDVITNELVSLLHPRIVRYYGAILTSKHYCIFMDYMPSSLDKKIKNLHENKIIHYSKQILEGVEFLHLHKIIHRDIKPQNILLDKNDDVKLTDFDFSKIMKQKNGITLCINSIFGTLQFLAPEVLSNTPYKYSADIWSVGITVINMINGDVPFKNVSLQCVLCKILNSKENSIPFPSSISNDMKWFLENMLKHEPTERLTASDLLSKCNLFKPFIDN